MTKRKVTLSLGAEILREVDEQAQKAGISRNEWFAVAAKRAIDRQITLGALDAMLAQIDQQEALNDRVSRRKAAAKKSPAKRRAKA